MKDLNRILCLVKNALTFTSMANEELKTKLRGSKVEDFTEEEMKILLEIDEEFRKLEEAVNE